MYQVRQRYLSQGRVEPVERDIPYVIGDIHNVTLWSLSDFRAIPEDFFIE
jgi:hypothetical protein